MPKKKDFKMPGHKLSTTTDDIKNKLDKVDSAVADVKKLLIRGMRPKEISLELGIPRGFVNQIMVAANLDIKDLIVARMYNWHRGMFQEHFGTWRFQFRITLPEAIKSWRVASIEPGKIIIETAAAEK